MSQMNPRGGKHPGEMPKAPQTGSGSKGKSPKHQCGNQPGYGKGGGKKSDGMKY